MIEAGCRKDRRAEVLDPNVNKIQEISRRNGDHIAQRLPTALLQLIAQHAMELIAADSASLHVFDGNLEVLVAGAGKADKAFLQNHRPAADGQGRQALRTGRRQHENQLPPSKVALSKAGVHAKAAFPIKLSSGIQGVLYVHFWRDHSFSEAELELVEVFAVQMAVAIQTSLLLHDFSRAEEKAWMLTGLQKVVRSLGADLEVAELLKQLAGDALYMLDAKSITIYEYRQDERCFGQLVRTGEFERPDVIATEVRLDDVAAQIVAHGHSQFFSHADTDPYLRKKRTENSENVRFVERERLLSCAALVLKSPYDGEIVGCLFANYDKRMEFENPALRPVISLSHSLASSAALAIKAARLHKRDLDKRHRDLRRRESELEAFRAVDRALVGGPGKPDLYKICRVILMEALRVLGPEGGAAIGGVLLKSTVTRNLEIVASHCGEENEPTSGEATHSTIVAGVAQELKPTLVNDVTASPGYSCVSPNSRSEIAVPILDDSDDFPLLLGIIYVAHQNVNAFSERDLVFIQALAVQAAIAIHTSALYARLYKQVTAALSLSTIATRIQDAQLGAETALRFVLTGLTAREGLGFSRAMLFEVDEETGSLRGIDAIGCARESDAHATWVRIRDLDLEQLLRIVEASSRGERTGESELRAQVRGICIPTDALPTAFKKCLDQKVAAWHRIALEELRDTPVFSVYEQDSTCAIVSIPLRGSAKTLGLVLADNRFLPNAHELDLNSEATAIAFAELAAMTIEGARLRASLADQEQLKNWRQASSRVAHILQSRVLTIEAMAGDASAALGRHAVRDAVSCLDKLESELTDMKLRFKRIQSFSAPQALCMQPVDLVSSVRRAIDNTARNLVSQVNLNLDVLEPVLVLGDANQLPDVFIDLMYNADRAMTKDGTASPRIDVTVRAGSDTHSVMVDVIDNGPGINPAICDSIFAPYVTQSASTGLGLAIISDLVKGHQGSITCMTEPTTGGAHFTVTFPTLKEVAAANATHSCR